MKVGDMVISKKTFNPFDKHNYRIGDICHVTNIKQLYDGGLVISITNDRWGDNSFTDPFFTSVYSFLPSFDVHFYTIREMRKMKLNKIYG